MIETFLQVNPFSLIDTTVCVQSLLLGLAVGALISKTVRMMFVHLIKNRFGTPDPTDSYPGPKQESEDKDQQG